MADDTTCTVTPPEGQVLPEEVRVMVDEDEADVEIPPVGDLDIFGAGEEKKEMEREEEGEDEEVTSLATSQASGKPSKSCALM